MKTKNLRILSLLLAVFMVVTIMPVVSFGASADLLSDLKEDNAVIRNKDFNTGWTVQRTGPDNPTKPVKVTLPYDAMLHDKRSPDSPSNNAGAYFVPGIYKYQKKFNVPKSWADKHVVLNFGSVYKNSKVYINGQLAAERPYGYVPFTAVADGKLKPGKENVVTVIADNSKMPNSRWYSGAGILRPVSLDVLNKAHIATDGVRVTTESFSPATVRVQTSTENAKGTATTVEIYDGTRKVASGKGSNVVLTVPNARLWSDTTPNLYTAKVTLTKDGKTVDSTKENFGIRKLSWSTKGFFVNGKQTLLRGGCVHSDNGILGAVSTQESEDRKIKIMKENGYNAIRSAHNPASKELLNACDKYGMYVMDEFADMWYNSKNPYDYGKDFEEWHTKDISAMVNKDYNHPSVVMYSIGNENSEPAKEKGVKTAKEMVDQIHREDSSRPVTAGVNLLVLMAGKLGNAKTSASSNSSGTASQSSSNGSLMFNTAMSAIGPFMNKMSGLRLIDKAAEDYCNTLDIVGYNYGSGRYAKDEKDHPDRIIMGTETMPQDIYDNWSDVEKYPYLIGDFMWTGWDYIGEAALGAWNYNGTNISNVKYPWLLSDSGAIDILGYPGAEAKYASTVWGFENKPYIGVKPVNHQGVTVSKAAWRGTNATDSWSWKDCNGNDAEVEVYTDKGTSAELFLNGKSLGKKDVQKDKAIFNIKYQPGTLTAVVYDKNGNKVGENSLTSATGTPKIAAKAETTNAKPGKIVYVDLGVLGDNGVVESNADRKVKVSVSGGELLGFGSANPCTEERFESGSYTTYYGRALAAVRVGGNGTAKVTFTDTTTGYTTTATINIH